MLRFAFSDQTPLSVAELRIALINYILAKQRNEGFVLWILDTESQHDGPRYDGENRELLEKFAIPSDRIFHQSEAKTRHQQLAIRLLEERKAFLCICHPEDLEREKREAEAAGHPYRYSGRCLQLPTEEIRRIREEKIPFTLRIRKPQETSGFRDLLLGERRAEPNEVDHFVILRADGTPTPLFATAVDDMIAGITLVVQEESELDSVPRQVHIRNALGYEAQIEYAHLPLLRDEEGHRIHAAKEAYQVRSLLKEGYLPDAILNYLLTLGIETPTEIFTLPDAVEWFDLKRIHREEPRFRFEELRRINREHLRRMEERKLSRLFGFADEGIGSLLKLFLEDAATINELDAILRRIFSPKNCNGDEGERLRILSQAILEAPYFENYEGFRRDLSIRTGWEDERLEPLLRRLIGVEDSDPAPETLYPHLKSYITEVARCQP